MALKTVGIAVGAWLAATLVLSIPVGILGSSRLVWGEPNQYGTVPIPGTSTVHLPKGRSTATVAILAADRRDVTPTLTIPDDLRLKIDGPSVRRDLARTQDAAGKDGDTQRQVFSVDAEHEGDYRVSVTGTFDGIGLNPQLWLGHGPPLPGDMVPAVAAALAALSLAAYWRFRR